MQSRTRRLGCLGLVLLLAALSPWWAPWVPEQIVISKYSPQIPFDAAVWHFSDPLDSKRTPRQQMIRDIVENVLPGKTSTEIESLLGKSPAHNCGYDEFEWDLLYYVGLEQVFLFDHDWRYGSVKSEALLIRFDEHNRFESCFVHGSSVWRKIVSDEALRTYRSRRME
jgi:hypothetical protein